MRRTFSLNNLGSVVSALSADNVQEKEAGPAGAGFMIIIH